MLASDGGRVVLTWFLGGTARGPSLLVDQHMLLKGIFFHELYFKSSANPP
jgi:hypothetical protein